MNAAWYHIAKSIFDRPDVDNISLEELDYLVEEYPYFPVVHFLRTRKLINDAGNEKDVDIGRTALYFSNPHWLQHQLQDIQSNDVQAEPMAEIFTTQSFSEALIAVLPVESVMPEAEIVQGEKEMLFDEKRIFTYGQNIPDSANTDSEIVDEVLPVSHDEIDQVVPLEISVKIPDVIVITSNEELENIVEQQPVANEEIIEVQEPVGESVREQPLFEPLYSIDYFASQGIKLKLEEEPTDKLSVKLRSFTDWLKAMKKIHPEKLDQKMGQEEENNIRVYAETSNEPKDLYTEALAEVYLQQGLRQKAATVFEKLSLLDPSKSAYFAARIRDIKEF